jgi:FkbM family methyltransferase
VKVEIPEGFRIEHGLLWPDMDISCAKVIFDMASDIPKVLKHVTDFSVCVQAGGNCGLWPRLLAPKFDKVYTAEPHPMNFQALVANTKEFENVTCLECAFGDRGCNVKVGLDKREANNCGAFYVTATKCQPSANIPMILIDDLELKECGLIYLDVEGFEEQALRGAESMIRKCRPVIAIEAKGLAKRYGLTDASCREFIESLGYGAEAKTNRDVIYTIK